MPRIRFTTDPKLPRDLAHLGYRKDLEVELDTDHCERWIRRGVAVYVPDPPAEDTRPGRARRRGSLDPSETLLGSSTLPATIEIAGMAVQLGTIVVAAHAASGLEVADWNALPEADREALLAAEVERRRAAAAPPPSGTLGGPATA